MFAELTETAPDPELAVPADVPSGGRWAPLLINRYNDGYRIAHFIDVLGKAVRILGWVAAAAVFAAGLMLPYLVARYAGRNITVDIERTLLVALGTALTWLLFAVAGTLISGGGHLLRAVLDQAVNNSPLINDEQRAEMLGL